MTVHLSKYDRRLQNRTRKIILQQLRSILELVPRAKIGGVITKRFVVFGQGRSGSTLLTSLLNSHPDIHVDGEILRNWHALPHGVVQRRLLRCGKRVYGFKLLSYQLDNVLCYRDPNRFMDWLVSEGFLVLYLRRNNLLQFALSQINARLNRFHQRDGFRLERRRPTVTRGELFWWFNQLENRFRYEANVLSGRDYLGLVYEDDLLEEGSWPRTVERVCNYLGVPVSQATTDFIKVNPQRLRDIVANSDEVNAMLRGTRYEVYLDDNLLGHPSVS